MDIKPHRPAWMTLLAFAIIYFVWGSTFLAIRIGVHEMPPLLFAAMRFTTAGVTLFGWTVVKRETLPDRRQWRSILLIAFLIFLVDYGLLFWAEQRVPSGVAAVILATIPVFMTLAEIIFLGTQRLTFRLAIALLIGLGGVGVLMSSSFSLGDAPVDRMGALALIISAISWAAASILSRKLALPPGKVMSSGAQMLVGGLMLSLASVAFREPSRFHPSLVSHAAWFALLYLTVAGSIIGFTAYVWLLDRESPTKVGTYAYVNPVVAVGLGYLLAGEALGLRTVFGTLCILTSVAVITTIRTSKPLLIPDGAKEQG